MNKYDFSDDEIYYESKRGSILEPFFNEEGKIEVENKEIMIISDLALKVTILENELHPDDFGNLSYENEFKINKDYKNNFDQLMRFNSKIMSVIYNKLKEVKGFAEILENGMYYFCVNGFIEREIMSKELNKLFLDAFLAVKSNSESSEKVEFMLVKMMEKLIYNLPKLREYLDERD